jgi:predicted GTPase
MGNTVRRVIIMGAGGRDFHNVNIVYCNRIFASQNGELAPE